MPYWSLRAGAAGSGDVTGPAGATSGHVAAYNGATGKLLSDGGVMPVTYDGALTTVNINGATDISEALADTDTIPAYNASGTANRKFAVSRIKTYVQDSVVRTVVDKTATYNVTTADSGKTFVMTLGTTTTFNLPSVDASNVGTYYTFVKGGAGDVVIDAPDSDTIIDSTAGGTLTNATAAEAGYANVTLELVSATKWIATGGLGTWTTA